ncbi:MAG TPA: DegT/DnrJ/EryC1/StrS family aminotransferase [Chthoniobacterales bacterium]|jgi:dTDP-4-amino-4,6-dideoxygalactose transaminase
MKPPVRTKERFLVYGAPAILQEEKDEVQRCLDSGWIGTGPKVFQFQSDFVAYKGGQGTAVAVNSCTAALHLSLIASGVGPGDEVITTALTFCSTVNAIIHAGATPVVADVDPVTMNIDPADVARKITPATKAVLPVHFAGRPCDMDALCALAAEKNLMIIEDCAHAIETLYHGRCAGTFGRFGCFSFYVTKNLTTGEGGMILTSDAGSADRLKVLGLHGMSKDAWKRYSDEGYQHYQVVDAGFKYNMTDIAASLGIHQLRRVETNWTRREEIWQRFQTAFADLPITLPAPPEANTRHAYHLYTILIDEAVAGVSRDAFLMRMMQQNIGTGVHYQCLPEHPYYRETFGWNPSDYPHAFRIGSQTASLPLSPALSDEDVEDVIEAVKRSLSGS